MKVNRLMHYDDCLISTVVVFHFPTGYICLRTIFAIKGNPQ